NMIDFLKYRLVYALFSGLLFLSFIGLCTYKKITRGYVFNYSVDFTGGTQILLRFKNPTSDCRIKDILEKNGLGSPIMRDFSPTEILVRLKQVSTDTKGLSDVVQKALQEAMPENSVEV